MNTIYYGVVLKTFRDVNHFDRIYYDILQLLSVNFCKEAYMVYNDIGETFTYNVKIY